MINLRDDPDRRGFRFSTILGIAWRLVAVFLFCGFSCDKTATGPVNRVRERWYRAQAGYAPPRPLIVGDRVIFAGTSMVYARRRDTGIADWSTEVSTSMGSRWIGSEEMIVRDGVLVVPVTRHAVGIDVVTGQELWSYAPPLDTIDDPDPIPGAVVLARLDGDSSTVFLPAWGASISALDVHTGKAKWVWRVDPSVAYRSGAEGVRLSGDTLFATVWHFLDWQGLNAEAWLIALDRLTGRELWKVALPAQAPGVATAGAPAFYRNLVIVTVKGGHEIAVDRTTQAVVWHFIPETQTATITGPTVYGDLVFHDGGDLSVHALRAADGSPVWKGSYSMMDHDLLVTERRVYGSNGGGFMIFDRLTGRKVANVSQPHSYDDLIASSAAFANGQIFVTVNGAAWSFDEP